MILFPADCTSTLQQRVWIDCIDLIGIDLIGVDLTGIAPVDIARSHDIISQVLFHSVGP
jgi:hypothetical protein